MPDGLSGAHPSRRNGLLLTTDAVGGVWRYTIDLARGLSERGIDPVVAVLGPPADAAQQAEAARVPRLRLVATGLPLDWTAEDRQAVGHAGGRLAALAALTGVGSVHLHAPALVGEARWPVPVVAVHHSCVGTWWRAVRGGPAPADLAWRIEATAHGLRQAAAVIAPSHAHAEAIRAVYGAVAIEVVHNGAVWPGSAWDDAADRTRAVLTAGRLWDEGKGAVLLDRAAPSVAAPVRAAGPLRGPNGAAVELPNLRHLGTLEAGAMARAYSSATVFASMACYEPFGLAVLEAAGSGMRLVLSDIPTFRELWDGAATFVVDPADLPARLQQALDTPGDGGARERAGRYTIEATVEGTLAVHRALVGAA